MNLRLVRLEDGGGGDYISWANCCCWKAFIALTVTLTYKELSSTPVTFISPLCVGLWSGWPALTESIGEQTCCTSSHIICPPSPFQQGGKLAYIDYQAGDANSLTREDCNLTDLHGVICHIKPIFWNFITKSELVTSVSKMTHY